jgi:tetratricopeptide (TPR) repeat protein
MSSSSVQMGPLLYRCYALWKAKAWDEMLRAAQVAVRADRRSSYAWQQLAIAHYALKDHRKAVTAARKAIELDPKNVYAMCNLALAQRRLGERAWIKTMNRALKLHPGLALHRDVARALAGPAKARRKPASKPTRARTPKRR